MANAHETLTSLFTDIADAIREKTGTTGTIIADEFPDKVAEIFTSFPNGKEWTACAGVYGVFEKILNAKGIWVGLANSQLYYSTDGKEWTATSVSAKSLCYGGGVFVSSYNNGERVYAVKYSIDGKNWIDSDLTGAYISKVQYTNGLWFASGNVGTNGLATLHYSVDGKTWSQSNISPYSHDIVYDNMRGFWIAGGSGLHYSVDGKVWTASNITSSTIDGIFYTNGVYVARTLSHSSLYYSIDGKTWNESTSKPKGSIDVLYTNNKGLFIAGTENYGLYYSTDGNTWTASNVTDSTTYTVCYANGLWVAGRLKGLWYSTDGKSWTQSNIKSDRFKRVVYANGMWVAHTSTGSCLYYSKDGTIWIRTTTSVSSEQPAIVNINAVWVAGNHYSVTWESA